MSLKILIAMALSPCFVYSLNIHGGKKNVFSYKVKKTYRQVYYDSTLYKDSTLYSLSLMKVKEDSIGFSGRIEFNLHLKGDGFLSDIGLWMPDSFYICLDESNQHVYLQDNYLVQKNIEKKLSDGFDSGLSSIISAESDFESLLIPSILSDVRLLFSSKESLLSSYTISHFKYFDYGEIYNIDSSRVELIQLKMSGIPGFDNHIVKPTIPIRKYEGYRCSIVRKYNHLNQCTSVLIREVTEGMFNGLMIEYIANIDLEI